MSPDLGPCRQCGTVMSESAVGENVGVAVEISFALVIHGDIIYIYVDFKAFPVFWPPYWISGR